MSSRFPSRTGAAALLLLLAAIVPAPDAPAAPAAPLARAELSIDDAPRLWSRVEVLRAAFTRWLSPFGVVLAATGEDPPTDPEDDDPFGGGADGDPGNGTGVADPNGGGT